MVGSGGRERGPQVWARGTEQAGLLRRSGRTREQEVEKKKERALESPLCAKEGVCVGACTCTPAREHVCCAVNRREISEPSCVTPSTTAGQ